MHSLSAQDPGAGSSAVPSAMQGGGTLERTLAVGWHIAPRVWPFAALACTPAMLLTLLGDVNPLEPGWRTLSVHAAGALTHALLAAALLPSVLRWFAEASEIASLQARDLRGRFACAAAASLVTTLLALLPGVFLSIRSSVPSSSVPSGWLIVGLLAGIGVALWIQLRLGLIVVVGIIERRGPLTAARRSWTLTRGRMLTIVGVTCVLALGWLVPVIAVALADLGRSADWNPTGWAGAIGGVLMLPWTLAFAAVLYHDARCVTDDVNGRRIAAEAAPV